MRFNVNESYRASRFHVIVEVTPVDGGKDAWTEEWFSRKAPAIAYAEKLMAKLAESCPENCPKVLVYDSQGPRDESRRTTNIRLAVTA